MLLHSVLQCTKCSDIISFVYRVMWEKLIFFIMTVYSQVSKTFGFW